MLTTNTIENDIKLTIKVQTDEKEYQEWRQKVTDQYLKTVEVPGFRKGKAPQHLALKNINQQALEQTIISEAINKYSQQAIKEAKEEMVIKNRAIIEGSYVVDPGSINTNSALKFNINAELLPDIEIDPTKLNVEEVKETEIPERISFEDFLNNQKNGFIASHTAYEPTEESAGELYKFTAKTTGTVDGVSAPELTADNMQGVLGIKQFISDFEEGVKGMKQGEEKTFEVTFPQNYNNAKLAGKKATFNVTLDELKKPIHTSFEDVLKKSDNTDTKPQQFTSEAEFDTYIKNYYDQETKQLTEQQWQKNVITSLTEQVSDFTMDEEKISTEKERIFEVIKKISSDQSITIVESFAKSGIPGADKQAKDEAEVRQLIEKYVRNEFKLATIWEFVYEVKSNKKISMEEIEKAAKEVSSNPQRFNAPKDITEDQAKNIAYNQLKKQTAAQWLFSELKKK